jgi:catechol 2,3-dioxygenase-like lactoylglutathione lyase family enzyme
MIEGAHTIVYSTDPEADRAFFRDVLGMPHVDSGGGWLIFGLPASEVAFHPAQMGGKHEFYLTVPAIEEFVAWMAELGVPCTSIQDQPWGRLVDITLPGGGALGVYEALHARPGSVGEA